VEGDTAPLFDLPKDPPEVVSLRLCNATTKAGKPCQRPAQGDSPFCLGHDPDKAAERRRTASRGGRGKVNKEARAVKELMDHLTEQVLCGELETTILYAAVAAQNTKLKALEVERRLEESDVRAEWEEVKRELGITS
jgi:hypothetical protein